MASDKDPQQPPSGDEPDFSNVQSGSSSTAPAPEPPAPETPEPNVYTVVAGDSLSKIAKDQYGDGSLWRQIFEANKDTIKNPDVIHPGQKLIIP